MSSRELLLWVALLSAAARLSSIVATELAAGTDRASWSMIELIRLRLRGAFSFGQSPWARTAVLVIEDPSACTAILPPPFSQVWMPPQSSQGRP